MEEVYLNIITDILNKAMDNPGHSISVVEICEIFIANRKRVLAHDQAEIFCIDLDTVDIAPIG